ncbi:sensor histidine kinase [Haloactinomyces albus]|uniref:histidine kinase n=1 Tax=Haloactinomyces albus TaxID=1352928 RepID=A0AAE4CLV8_9ACTN|nr:histidine kinase [Haloactinomyces albus]MDR7302244.1 signal transduction histidine kinase [Haloactinomyces albus]
MVHPSALPTPRDAAFAVGFFLGGSALYWLDGGALVPYGNHGSIGWRPALLAAICLAQLWRSRRPLTALTVGLVVTAVDGVWGFSLPVLLVLGELLHAVVLYGSARAQRWTVRVLVTGTALLMLVVAVLTRDMRWVVLVPLLSGALFFTPVWWARDVRSQSELAELERMRSDELARIAELDRREAVAAERARMARDLHDVVASHLSAIALQSSALLTTAHRDQAQVHTVAGSVRENSVAALDEMRAMIGLLRGSENFSYADSHAAPHRLADLETLLDSARAGGLRVDRRISGVDGIPAAPALAAYRITQQALANATQHAPGARVSVRLHGDGERLVAEVENELTTDPRPGNGLGLETMRERAEMLGGSFHAEQVARSWRVRAVLPLERSRT